MVLYGKLLFLNALNEKKTQNGCLYLRVRESVFSLLLNLFALPKDGAILSLEHSRLSGLRRSASPAKTVRPMRRLLAGWHPCLESHVVTCPRVWPLEIANLGKRGLAMALGQGIRSRSVPCLLLISARSPFVPPPCNQIGPTPVRAPRLLNWHWLRCYN